MTRIIQQFLNQKYQNNIFKCVFEKIEAFDRYDAAISFKFVFIAQHKREGIDLPFSFPI